MRGLSRGTPTLALKFRCVRIIDDVQGVRSGRHHVGLDRAPHFSGMDANEKHARLFGHVRTDDAGQFVLHTIRPGGYPRSTTPEHIHVHVDLGTQSLFVGGIVFDDDPRLTKEMREQPGRDLLVKVEKEAGKQIVRPEFQVDVAAVPPEKGAPKK